ncbi:MAG: hypothetical protein K2K64_12510 [Muribaculaceae bacterium]|nr:hypothetical protein [Muribaculaceae bacterium]
MTKFRPKYIAIRNVVGSSKISPNPPSPFGSWIGYWEAIYRDTHDLSTPIRPAYECPFCSTTKPTSEIVGGHVQKVDEDDQHWYIFPICSSCNKDNDKETQIPYESLDLLIPVPSNLIITEEEETQQEVED